jgi:K+-transporting ATPase ATPase B chain
MSTKAHSLFDPAIVIPALGDSVQKTESRVMIKNPVMFVTMVGAAVTTAEIFASSEPKAFTIQISVWLWFTVLFANFAEAWRKGAARRRPTPCAVAQQDVANALASRPTGTLDQVDAERSCARAT